MRHVYLVALTLGIDAMMCTAVSAQSHSELQSLVQQLQSNPSDTALRERIITMARELKPPPAVPEEARRHFVKGTTIAKAATDAAGQALAVKSFEEALKLAPWWGDAWYNLAIAQELTGQLDAARTSLKLYILTGPEGDEARKAQDRIYALEAKQELGNEPGAVEDRFLKSLDGAVFVRRIVIASYNICGLHRLAVRGQELVGFTGVPCDNPSARDPETWRIPLARVMTYPDDTPECGTVTVRIAADGRTLTTEGRCRGQPPYTAEYVRAP